MKKKYLLFAILTILIFVALFTNPSLEQQKEIVKEELKFYLESELAKQEAKDSENLFVEFGANIGRFFGGLIIDPLVESMLSSDNYVLFSITKISWEGKKEIIGIAAFNNIFFFKSLENLSEELQNK